MMNSLVNYIVVFWHRNVVHVTFPFWLFTNKSILTLKDSSPRSRFLFLMNLASRGTNYKLMVCEVLHVMKFWNLNDCMLFSDRTADVAPDRCLHLCLYAFFSSLCKVFSVHIVAFFSSMNSKKEKTTAGWWVNFLYCCATNTVRPRPPAPLLPDLPLAAPPVPS